MRNSGVAHAPDNMELTMNTMFTKPPQKLFRFVGAVELPPIAVVPLMSHGYMVMEAQYGAMLVSSFLYIKWCSSRSIYLSASSLPYIFLMRSVSRRRFRRMKFDFGNSPMSVAMFLCSTLALASNFEPVAALAASM